MNSGTSYRIAMLAILMDFIALSYGKAVPEDSNIGGYEYSYNYGNGQYEIKPIYNVQNVDSQTKKPELHNERSGVFENNGEPIFLPPIEKSKAEMNKILEDYYGSKNKFNEQFKKIEKSQDPKYSKNLESAVSTDYPDDKHSNEYEFKEVKTVKHKGKSTPSKIETSSEKSGVKYYTPEVRQVYMRRKSGSKEKHKKVNEYENYGDFKEVKIDSLKKTKPENKRKTQKPTSKAMHTAKTQFKETKTTPLPGKEYTWKTILKENKPSEDHDFYRPEIKSKKSDFFTKKEGECKDKSKSNENVKSCTETSESYENETPKTVSMKPGVKLPIVKEYDVEDNLDSFTKCKDSKSSDKSCSENSNSYEHDKEETPKTVSVKKTGVKMSVSEHDVENKDTNFDPFTKKKCKNQKSSDSCSKNSDLYETKMEYDFKIKENINSDSFTKKCKDSKSSDKSCPENSNLYEPDMEESPKTGSIKSSGVKSPVINLDSEDESNKKHKRDFFSVIEKEFGEVDVMDKENRTDVDHDISNECDKLNELKPGDVEANKLNAECRSDVDIETVPNFLEGEDKLRSLSFLNSNLWSLISNPNPKNLKQSKCLTRKNEVGHCMYIQNCPVQNIANSLEQLLNNACVMDEVFIGICCPEFPVETVRVHWEDTARNSSDEKTEDEFREVEGELIMSWCDSYEKSLSNLFNRFSLPDCGTRSKEAAKKNLWPWKAPLLSKSNGKVFCGGVIISERYVLTAAHCTTKIPKNQILVRLGQDDESPGEDIPVIEIKRHAQYSPRTMQNDIALLKLDRKVMLTDDESTSMICLPEDSDSMDSHSGDKAILLGWQGLSGVNPRKSEILNIISNEECREKLNANVHQSLLCTESRNENERTCNADSGAPLVIEDDSDEDYEVVGILSWNRNDCDPRFPSTFSRVSSYLQWIRKHAV